jgi:deoxyribodipyrimidine photolyase
LVASTKQTHRVHQKKRLKVQRTPIHLVWLKRDLRLSDHRPIFEASQSGPTVVLYVFEPELWAMPEMDRSHFDFIAQSIQDLSQNLAKIGGRLSPCCNRLRF